MSYLESLKKDYASLEKKAHDRLIEDNMSEDEIVIQRVADCRYEGQGYEMRVPVIGGEVTEETIEKMKESFHIAHKKQFGRSYRQVDIEIVNIRVIGTGEIEDLEPIKIQKGSGNIEDAVVDERMVTFKVDEKPVKMSTKVYDRTKFGAGIVDTVGRQLCESESTPMHVGSIGGNVKGILTRWKLEDIHEGDAFIHNHPFHGTSHSPDINTYIGSTAINYFTLTLFGIDNWFLWFIIFAIVQIGNTMLGLKGIDKFASFAAPCIIVGRCSNYVLENANIPTIDVFVAANLEDRIKNIMKRKHLSHENVKNHLIKKEKCRESYFNYYTSYEWGKPQYYDLCVNTSSMDLDDLVDHVESYINTNISNHIGKK